MCVTPAYYQITNAHFASLTQKFTFDHYCAFFSRVLITWKCMANRLLPIKSLPIFLQALPAQSSKLTSYNDNNLVVDAVAVAVKDPQIQQEKKYQCGHKRKQMIKQNNR
jgi:hypothetical protein